MADAALDRRGLLALAGAGWALASLAFPYATLSGPNRTVRIAASLSPRSPLLALPVLVISGAVLAVIDSTRGEQLLGALFAVALLATVVGPLFVADRTGHPGPGLWLLLVGWILVDAADDLDPALSNSRADRRVALGALAVLLVAGSMFLWRYQPVRDPHDLARTTLVAVSALVATVAWLTAAAWEWTAERE